MSFKISLFQIQENGTATGIQKVAGTEWVYEGNSSTDDFNVIRIDDIETNLEIEEGVYRVGNVGLTVDSIPAEHFNDYNEVIATPYVLVVENTSTSEVLFHGVIDPESIRFNPTTQYHAMTAYSWDWLLDQHNVAARSVFETEFAEEYNSNNDSGQVVLKKLVDGYDLSVVVNGGDVLVFDTNFGEFRATALADPIDNGDGTVNIIIGETPQKVVEETTVDVTEVPLHEGYYRYNIEITDKRLYYILKNADLAGGFLNSLGSKSLLLHLTDGTNEILAILSNKDKVIFDDDNKTVTLQISFDAQVAWLAATGLTLTFNAHVNIEGGTSVRILSREVYGYKPTFSGSYKTPYETDGVINAMFVNAFNESVPSNVLQYVYSGTINIEAGETLQLHRFIELPENPFSALSLIQNTNYTFLRLDLDMVSGLPTFDVTLIPRTKVNETDITPVAISDISKWNEHAADNTPTAVIVTPNKDYFKPKEVDDVLGFYYATVDADEADDDIRKAKGRPIGDRVIEIEVGTRPSHTGTLFAGEGKPIRNDTRLKEIARRFYEFYQNVNRPASARIENRRSDLLGKYVSASEMDFDAQNGRSGFVTSQRTSLSDRATELDMRLGEYVEAKSSTPTAAISGRLVYDDTDSNGTERVRLTGVQSFDPLDTELDYEWTEGMTVLGTDVTLDVDLSVGEHTIQLKVTNDQSNTDTATVTVYIQDGTISDTVPPENIPNSLFDYEKYQDTEGGDRYGYVKIYPRFDITELTNIRYRAATGSELSEIDKSSGDKTTWYPNLATQLSDEKGTYYEAKVQLAKLHNSNIEIYADFTDQSRFVDTTDVFTFDWDKDPNVTASLSLVVDEVYLGFNGQEDLNSITYATSTSSMPTDTAAENGTAVNGQEADAILLASIAESQTLYVKVVGWSGTNGTGIRSATAWTGSVERPAGTTDTNTIAPTVDADYTQTGLTGNYSLNIVDVQGRTTRMEVWEKNAGSSETKVIDDTVTPFNQSGNVSIGTKHGAIVRWRLTWQDDSSTDNYITGTHTYDPDTNPNIETISLTKVNKTSTSNGVEVDAQIETRGDEDTQSLEIEESLNGAAFSFVTYVNDSGGSPSYVAITESGLQPGDNYRVRVTPYSGLSGSGSAGTSEVREIENNGFETSDIPDKSILVGQLESNAQQYVLEPSSSTGLVFEATDDNRITINNFTIRSIDGTVNQSITGDVDVLVSNPITYVYADLATNSTNTTTTWSTVTGDSNHILIAVARPDNSPSPHRAFVVGINSDVQLNAVNINVVNLQALSANMGDLNVDGSLTIQGSGGLFSDSGTITDGWAIDGTSIRGIGGSTVQIEINASDGTLTAGDDNVVLSEDGIVIQSGSGEANKISWVDTGTNIAEIRGGNDSLFLQAEGSIFLQTDLSFTGTQVNARFLNGSNEISLETIETGTDDWFGTIRLRGSNIRLTGNNVGLYIEKSVAAVSTATHGRLWVDSNGDLFWRPPGSSTDTQLN